MPKPTKMVRLTGASGRLVTPDTIAIQTDASGISFYWSRCPSVTRWRARVR